MTARVRRLLQRNSQAKESITVGGAALNLVFGRIEFQGKSLELSKKELQIIYYLFLNRGRTVLKDELVEYLWENKWYVDENILNVNLSRLRKRLGEIGTGGFSFNGTETRVPGREGSRNEFLVLSGRKALCDDGKPVSHGSCRGLPESLRQSGGLSYFTLSVFGF